MKENYKILIDSKVKKFLLKLDDYQYDKITRLIKMLSDTPRQRGCVKLKTEFGYRIRWSNFRILYTIDDVNKIVNIFKISDRKDAYTKN